MAHPRNVLLGAQGAAGLLPVCDHYSGVEARMVKSLQLQAEMMEEFGACVFDVTLDCEDGAPVGGEVDHANMVVALANTAQAAPDLIANVVPRRVGARLHAVDHPAFASDVQIVLGGAAKALSYIMVPKVESIADVERAVAAIDAAAWGVRSTPVPLHVLIESPAAVQQAFEIAAHPRVESISFGLMDFVSSHGGAIPASAMGVRAAGDMDSFDQFHHPLVLRAKTDISSACHAYGKVPSHCVVTEFKDTAILQRAARMASQALGYTRMWSIHPDQIRPILEAFSPSTEEVEQASDIVLQAQKQEWAPIAVRGKLHDRASYRYFWQVLERAHQTGRNMPNAVQAYFSAPVH
ncbi:HpcH/HpaI aldolase/citrate lyase family protein [Rhodoferax saidenbachensis]|uniref:CoA ester lyase n=1 Tax=Rhodoferax saidenbachensis TaxID=1484693 RepID=A0A1P8K874_9BURK|nr:aldolase/citrate lyase family protein [Rhodoferax saidenbachensis]APW42198.1 CoA ester lyase [Rhodoferax saidenbachensis]